MGIIKDSTTIKEALINRLKELYPSNMGHGYKNSAVVKDASERGFKIASESLSRYMSDSPQKNSLSEAQIIWLCLRYGIPIQLNVGRPVIKDNKIVFEIPKYNELESLIILKQVFGG